MNDEAPEKPRIDPASDTRELRESSTYPSRDSAHAEIFQQLLHMAVTLPVRDGPRRVVSVALDTLTRQAPDLAIGVCVVDPIDQSQIIDVRVPEGADPPGRDPTRLFPNLTYEDSFRLEGLDESTLHIASFSAERLSGEKERLLASQGARVLGAALRTAFDIRGDAPSSQDPARLQEQLIQAEKLAALGHIVAGVVHELANPLTSLVAYADYLTKKARGNQADPEDVERLERMREAAERVLKFSRDLVAYARPATEEPGVVSINEVINQASVFCEHEFSKNDVTLEKHFQELPAVSGRTGPLTQVFVNLFTNAAHAMSDHGGRLSVRTDLSDDGQSIRVQVTDDGIGIQANVLDQIFEPFFTTKQKGQGTGLGLSIVREIVDAHGGMLNASSTPGEGTTFTLVLPVYVPDSSWRYKR